MAKWSYSIALLISYISLFIFWKYVPSRFAFAAVGVVLVSFLSWGLWRARQTGYFVNRVDICLHAYVVVDLLLESLSFEGLLLFQPYALVDQFHNNNNFVLCTLTLAALVGGYRFYALTLRRSQHSQRLVPEASMTAEKA